MDDKELEQLIGDEIEDKEKEKKEVKKTKPPIAALSKDDKKKSETLAFETPQDRFRRIVKDMGLSTGVENMTSVFFEGDTDSPIWLNRVLQLSHVPGKSRELIITAYYGKQLTDLGLSQSDFISTASSAATPAEKAKIEEAKKLDVVSGDQSEILKMTEDQIRDQIKDKKTLIALKRLKQMEKELDHEDKKEVSPQPQMQMRQVVRPVIRDGKVITREDGTFVTETIFEPINSGSQGGGTDIFSMMALMNMMGSDKKKDAPSEVVESIKLLTQQIADLKRENEVKSKDAEINRLIEKLDKKDDEYKKEIERKERETEIRLAKEKEDRIRELTDLKERFTETIAHKRELDSILGQVSSEHKKEMDSIKKQLEHTQTNIERTVVAKGTDTVDKISGKVMDIAETVIKPMASVMKDHYTVQIDQQRKQLGLPSLKETVPVVTEDELEKFAGGN